MSQYLILMYEVPLSDIEQEQISNICYDAKIEYLGDDDNHAITAGYFGIYDYSSVAFCYRIHVQDIEESIGLIGKEPIYIARFNDQIEAKCTAMGKFCLHMADEIRDIDGLWDKAKTNVEWYGQLFGEEGDLDWRELEQAEDDYRNMLIHAEKALSYFFIEHGYSKFDTGAHVPHEAAK